MQGKISLSLGCLPLGGLLFWIVSCQPAPPSPQRWIPEKSMPYDLRDEFREGRARIGIEMGGRLKYGFSAPAYDFSNPSAWG